MKQSNPLIDDTLQVGTMPPLGEVAKAAVAGWDLDSIKVDESAIIITDNLSHSQLLKALYWVYDFMDRALINFFLVGDTAQAVRAKKDLFGDKITVGVRKLEWESGARQIADAFATPVKEEKYTVQYQYEGVPITLYVLEDDVTISSPDQQMYASEFFKLPNPYSKFEEVFAWVK